MRMAMIGFIETGSLKVILLLNGQLMTTTAPSYQWLDMNVKLAKRKQESSQLTNGTAKVCRQLGVNVNISTTTVSSIR